MYEKHNGAKKLVGLPLVEKYLPVIGIEKSKSKKKFCNLDFAYFRPECRPSTIIKDSRCIKRKSVLERNLNCTFVVVENK